MSDYSALQALIDAYITQNGNNEITGQIMNSILNAIVDKMGTVEDSTLAEITEEIERAETAEEALAEVITTITSTYATTEALQDEASARSDADETLQTNIDAEASARSAADTALQTEIDTKADDADVVHLTGNESIAGEKTFQESAMFQNGMYIGLSQEIMTDSEGNLAFSSPISADGNAIKNVGTPSDDTDAANKAYVDAVASDLDALETTVSGHTTSIAANATAITAEASARASADSAIQSDLDTLESTVAGHTTSIAALETEVATKQDTLTFDTTPTSGSTNPVTSGGVYSSQEEIKNSIFESETTTTYLSNEGGFFRYDTGGFVESAGRGLVIIPIKNGHNYKINTCLTSTIIAGIIYTSDSTVTIGTTLTNISGYELVGSGSVQTISNYVPTIPSGSKYMIVQNAAITEPSSVVDTSENVVFYSKDETYSQDEVNTLVSSNNLFGVRWNINDSDDLGERVFGAVGKTASIGIGNTNGASDFDTIYPWSEIKRCNIKVNENGAKIVTFEGETGFALDGSNGDVFVRIPKFYVEKYIEDGYEYRVISATGTSPHKAFVENGVELDEIFIGAYEGYSDGSALHSYSGVIPTNNVTASDFLSLANANGANYSLYDMRCVDAVWTLMAVEFGCRNTNQILGYGIADYYQPVYSGRGMCIESASNTNTIKTDYWTDAYKAFMPVGSNITICANQDQEDILTQAELLSVTDAEDDSYTVFTFDGDPIDVDTDCFIGSAPCNTDFADTCTTPLTWHTGRALFVSDGEKEITRNPVRYRWIENPVGNVWHFLPDVLFASQQMFVCENMTDYDLSQLDTTKYKPIGATLTAQVSNGNKGDSTDVNYWISELMNDPFAKGSCFAKAYDMSLVSTQGFGGYYYLSNSATPVLIANGGGFDHLYRCNMLTHRAWITLTQRWYLYGARLIYKNI